MPNSKPFTEEQFKELYSKVTRLSVDLIIEAPGGVVLSLRSLPTWHNQWHLPGGMILYKETVRDAVARIARNELGVAVTYIKPLGYIEYPSEEKERGFGWTIAIAILCEAHVLSFKPNNEASKIETFIKLPETTITEQKVFLLEHCKDFVQS